MVLAQLTPETQKKLKAIVPNATALSNPVDAGGGTDPRAEYYGLCGRAILEDPNIDALLFVGFFGGYTLRYGESVAADRKRLVRRAGRDDEALREADRRADPLRALPHQGARHPAQRRRALLS